MTIGISNLARIGLAGAMALGISAAAMSAAQADMMKIKVSKAAQDPALVMAEFGQSQGIFKKHNLEIETALITQSKMIQAMVSGSIDMSLSSGADFIFAAKGAPIKAVGALSGPPSVVVLVVRPDNSVPDVQALKGKTLAISNVGSLTDWTVAVLAASKGVDSNTIKRVSVGDTPSRVAALKTKAADATVIDIAAALRLEKQGEVKILSGFDEAVKDFQNQAIWASDAAIKEKPEAVRAFVQSWYETIAFAKTHKAEVVAFWQKELGLDKDIAGQVYDHLVLSNFFSTDGKITQATLKHMANDFAEQKRIPAGTDLSKNVDASFLPK